MTLLLTLLTTVTARANELTVYDGTLTSYYVPYIYYWDDFTKSQYIIPADSLSDMVGCEISTITLYSTLTETHTTDSEADVYLMEVDYSSFSGTVSFKPKSQAITVYHGTLSFDADGKTTIEFTAPFEYSGKNLLIGFENTTDKGYKEIYFYGKTSAAAMIFGNNGNSLDDVVTANLRAFIPKTTFTYTIGSGCAKPTLSASNISHKGATLTVGGGSGTYNVQYALETSDEWQDVAQNSTETAFELTGLSALTDYKARVQSVCDGDATSSWQVVYFTTTQEVPDVSEGWSDDFEGTSCGWELINGDIANAWAWGTAANCGDGTKALYISNDGGTSNAYTSNGKNTTVYAAKLLYFANGKYQISYNWMAKGENTYDYLRAALVPASVKLTASQNLPTGFSTSALPTGWIALDGGGALNLKSDWQSKDVAVRVDGTYYLVFAWRNDNADDNNPPAAIDNVSITKLEASYNAEDLSVGSVTTTSATISWEGDAEQWQVTYADNEAFQNATETTVSTNSYDLTGLQPNTHYYVKVRAYFGGTTYGEWSEVLSFKSAILITDFPWNEDFESLLDDKSIPESWDNSDGTTTDAGYKWCYKTGSQGPTVTSGHNGSRCIRFNSYNNPSDNTNFLKTPFINLPADKVVQLTFWYKNPAGGDFSVYISTDGGATYTTQLATGLTGKNEWTEKQISLADYAGTDNVVIVFKGTSNFANGDAYIYLDDVNITATVKKQLQDSWIQNIAALTYNGAEQMPTITVKDGETVLQPWDETTQTGDYTVSYSNNKDAALSTAEDAPTVTITAVENSDKYIGTASKTFTIGKANLEVKADNFRIGYGTESPAYTATYTGFVGDDTESVLSGTLAISCPYVQGNDVNTYIITLSGLFSSNYDITFVPGTLTVLLPVNYLDMSGTTQTCNSYYSLDGSETTLGVAGEDTWYVAEDTLNYAHGLTFNGDVHFILKEGAVMNIGTEENPVSGNGLGTSGDSHFSIDVFGQSTDADSNGQLNVYAENSPVWVFFGDFNCSSARLTLKTDNSNNCLWAMDVDNNGKGNINLKDATVIVAGQGNGIYAQGGNIAIDGGKVTATGSRAIYSDNSYSGGGAVAINGGQVTANGSYLGFVCSTITLGWTSLTDFVKASSYNNSITIAEGKIFIDEEGNTYGSGSYSNFSSFAGKKLMAYVEGSVAYLDADGQRQLCVEFTELDGTESSLAAGWYVADGTLDYTDDLTLSGDVNLILKDGASMNVGSISGGANLTVYGQTKGTGVLNATGSLASGDIAIYGGRVSADDMTATDHITLGWTVGSNFVQAGNYTGTVVLTKDFVDEENTQHTADNIGTIAGQKLYPYLEGGIIYLDMDGQRSICADYTVLTGSEPSMLDAGWYVAEDTLNYTHGFNFTGDVHFILKDGAVLNIGTEESPVNGNGLGNSGQYYFSISVYGQSTDADHNGQLNVYASGTPVWAYFGDFNSSSARLTLKTNSGSTSLWAMDMGGNNNGNVHLKDAIVIAAGKYNGIFAQGGNITIDGGKVTATANNAIYACKNTTGGNIIINGGEVEATAATNALLASGGAVTINGGQVTANGEINGIYGDTITLGWTSLTDFVKVSSYNRPFTIADGKTFVDEDGNICGSGSYSDCSSFAGKTLVPYITATITMNADGIMTYASEYDLDFSAVSGLTAYVATGISDNTLTLTPVDKVPAGTGLLLKGDAGETFTVPTPYSATAIDNNLLVGLTGETDVYQTTADGIAFILADGNHGINWYRLAEEHCTLKANSAYLRLPASVAPSASRALTMAFEDGTTGITPASSLNGGEWYDLNGRKLSKKPTRKGLYIFNGRKTLVN